ncbi:MAG: DUF2931 family protein [Pedobacter sp.]|nr:MAG: DUF2931 family protein [Pedobacter sp.]
MKINNINKFYILFTFLLLVGIIYRVFSFKAWERYDYVATVTVPNTYPIAISEAYFITLDDDLQSIYSEDVDNFNSTWQNNYTTSTDAKSARLPEKLVLEYFSYRDKLFYRDTLDLPHEKIKTIFESARKNKQLLVLSQYAGVKKGLTFMIGVANKGNLVVWLRGVNLEQEILKISLKPKNVLPESRFYEKDLTKESYFDKLFTNLPDSVKLKLDSGFDANANYIDSPSRYIENNTELWDYQIKNGYIDYKK